MLLHVLVEGDAGHLVHLPREAQRLAQGVRPDVADLRDVELEGSGLGGRSHLVGGDVAQAITLDVRAQPAVGLGIGLEGVDRAGLPDLLAAHEGVLAHVGPDVDERHPRTQ